MTCERCGHALLYGPARFAHGSEQCIANLRADLAKARQDATKWQRMAEEVQRLNEGIHEHRRIVSDLNDETYGELETCRADLEAERARSWAGWSYAMDVFRTADATYQEFVEIKEHAARAEAQCVALRGAAAQVAETQPFYPDTHTGMRQQWVKVQIAAKIRALPPDAGRDLLTAVRRLCEAARALLFSGTAEAAVKSTCDLAAALGDPALAGLRGAP